MSAAMTPIREAHRQLAHNGPTGVHLSQEEVVALLDEREDLIAALRSGIASMEQLVKIGRIPENMQGLRDMRAALAKAGAL